MRAASRRSLSMAATIDGAQPEWLTAPRACPPRRRSSVVRQPWRALAQFVNPLRCVGLGERVVERFAGLAAQRFEIGALRRSHRFVTSFPVIRIALELSVIV